MKFSSQANESFPSQNLRLLEMTLVGFHITLHYKKTDFFCDVCANTLLVDKFNELERV